MSARRPRPPKLDLLEPLIGVWRTNGHVVDEQGRAGSAIVGTDAYRWLAGRWFVVHDVDVTMGGEPVIGIELIAYDADTGRFVLRSFDSAGAITDMEARVDDDGIWTFTGGGDVAATGATPEPSSAVRSTLTVARDGRSMHARWERSPDGRRWIPWMLVDFARER